MRALLLGGTGFISGATARALLASGHAVACVTRGRASRPVPAGALHIRADRAALAGQRAELARFRPDVAIDALALTPADAEQVCAVLRDLVGRAVVMSSCDVYRAYGVMIGLEEGLERGVCRETSPLRGVHFPYRERGDAALADYEKIRVEQVYQGVPELRASVVRLPMVYGPADPQRRFAPYVAHMRAGADDLRIGTGLAGWRGSRGFVEDVGAAVAAVATAEAAAGRTYNVAEPEALREIEWIGRIAALLDWKGRVVRVRESEPPFDVRQDLRIDSSRIRAELGFAERYARDAALAETIAALE